MSTRKVSVFVFSYPETVKVPTMFPLFSDELGEVLEFQYKFLSDSSLEDVLSIYVEKTKVFAINKDCVFWYRVVVRDTEGRIVKIFKA